MHLLINISIMFVLFNLNSAFPHHELSKQHLDKLSYVLTDSVNDFDEKQQHESINGLQIDDRQTTPSSKRDDQKLESTASSNKYSNLVSKIIKQILSNRSTMKMNAKDVEQRRRKNVVEQIEKNDLIKSSIIDKKFKLLSELTLKRLKPAFELQLPDMSPEEHDELVNDINKLINEDGSSFRRRDSKR